MSYAEMKSWAETLARTARESRYHQQASIGVAVIDPADLALYSVNPFFDRLLGETDINSARQLRKLHRIPSPKFDELQSFANSPYLADDCRTIETVVTWPDATVMNAVIHLSRIREVRGRQFALILTVTEVDNTLNMDAFDTPPDPQPDIQVVNDADLFIIGADQRLAEFGVDPQAHAGCHAFLTMHPEDAVRIAPAMRSVAAGHSIYTSYDTRVAGPAGRWTNVHIQLRYLVCDPPLVVTILNSQDTVKPTIESGLLTVGEHDVVRRLFDGMRISQIAQRRGVSVKTVRNQLVAVYQKLGVTGQTELLNTFAMPTRPAKPDQNGT